ncbi:MAG: DUF4401 domain-containing protein [Chloroflexota bacterium]
MSSLNDILNQLNIPAERRAQIEAFANQAAADHAGNPWYVTALIGGSAWIAAILLGIFVVWVADTIFDLNTLYLAGLIPLLVGIAINRLDQESIFFNQLALALGMAGQSIVVVDIVMNYDDLSLAILPILGVIVFVAHRHRFHRFFTAVINTVAFDISMADGNDQLANTLETLLIVLLALGIAWIWLSLSKIKIRHFEPVWRPLGFGLILSNTFFLIFQRVRLADSLIGERYAQMSGLLILAVLLLIVYQLAREYEINPLFPVLIAGLLLGFPAWQTPGVVWSIFLLVIGWQRQERLLLGLGVIFLLGFLILFYYDLEILLLYKSYILLSSGIGMGGLYMLLNRLNVQNLEVS